MAALLLVGCAHTPAGAPPTKANVPATVPAPAEAVSTPPAPPVEVEAPTPELRRQKLAPAETIAVGKWPEGIAVTPDTLWVAQSGARNVARIARTPGATPQLIKVGRLPVDLLRTDDGTVLTIAATDDTLVAIEERTGKTRKVVKTPDYTTALTLEGQTVWALMYAGRSSMDSSVLRIDLATGATRASGPLGPNAFGLDEANGKLWVARKDGLTVVHAESLEKLADLPLDNQAMEVFADGAAVFVGGKDGVLRVDPESLKVTHRLQTPARVVALTRFGDELAVLDQLGGLWLAHPETLVPRVLLETEASDAHAMVAEGSALFVTVHRGQGEGGSVLVFRPGELASKP